MIIEFERVLGAFSLLADIDEAEARNNSPIVHLAIDEVESYVTKSELTGAERDKLYHAAAACAYYKFVSVLSTREGIDVSVGDVKITQKDVQIARAVKDDAINAIRPFSSADDFAVAVM